MASRDDQASRADLQPRLLLTASIAEGGSFEKDASFRMSDEVLEEFTRQYIDAQNVPQVTFGWQGGEPTLMGLDFFRKAVELQRKYAPPGMDVRNSLQTNGVLLNEEWCEFLRDNSFLVGLSLDGPKDLHDANRVDKGGKPTFDRVLRALKLMQRMGVEHNVLCLVNSLNSQRPRDVYRFYRDQGVQFIQFIRLSSAGDGRRHGLDGGAQRSGAAS